MTTKALRKQLAAAIAMVVVAGVALSSSTYAWFAINGTVTATGAQFKTQVSNNLFIASNDSASKATESEFVTTIKNDIDALLEPVSTIDGLTYFYADKTNVVNTGATKTSEWYAYDTSADEMTKFNNNYGTTGAVGYVDYVYQLKAVAASSVNIYLDQLNLTYGGDSDVSGTDANKTPRIAVFAQDITKSDASDLTSTDLLAIYSASGAKEFTDGKAVKTTTSIDSISKKNSDAVKLTVVDPSTTGYNNGTYYLITVRMWLEGEDTTCNNATFAKIDDKWSLDMAWSLADATHTASVENIATSDTASKTEANSATVTNAAATNVVNDGVTYYKTNLTLNSNVVYTLDTTISATSRYFTYIDGVLKEVTNQFKYTESAGTP